MVSVMTSMGSQWSVFGHRQSEADCDTMAWSSDAIDGDVAEQRAWGKPPGGGRPYDGERFYEVGGGEAAADAAAGPADTTDSIKMIKNS